VYRALRDEIRSVASVGRNWMRVEPVPPTVPQVEEKESQHPSQPMQQSGVVLDVPNQANGDSGPAHVVLDVNQVQPEVSFTSCAVCLNQLDGDIMFFACGHRFHRRCGLRSIMISPPRCPVCRSPVQMQGHIAADLSLAQLAHMQRGDLHIPQADVIADVDRDIVGLPHVEQPLTALPIPVVGQGQAPAGALVPGPPDHVDASAGDHVIEVDPEPLRPVEVEPSALGRSHEDASVEIQPVVRPGSNTEVFGTLAFVLLLCFLLAYCMCFDVAWALLFTPMFYMVALLWMRIGLSVWRAKVSPTWCYSAEHHFDRYRALQPHTLRALLRHRPTQPRQVWWYFSMQAQLDKVLQSMCFSLGIQNSLETARILNFRYHHNRAPADDTRPIANRNVHRVDDDILLELSVHESRHSMSSRLLIISPEVRNAVVPQLSNIRADERMSLASTRARAGIAQLAIDAALADEVIESTALAAHIQANNNDMDRVGVLASLGLNAQARQDSCSMGSGTVCLILFLCGLCLIAAREFL